MSELEQLRRIDKAARALFDSLCGTRLSKHQRALFEELAEALFDASEKKQQPEND